MDKRISTRGYVNYDSKMQRMDSRTSGSFSVRIRELERTIVRSPSGREFLAKQKPLGKTKDASTGFTSEIPNTFLADEETCKRYVAGVFSKAKVSNWTQQHIIPKICNDVINMSRRLGEEGKRGFLVEAQIQVVNETLLNNCLCANDYDSEGRLIPTEEECVICQEELSSSDHTNIMKLPCSHNFHKDCLLPWLRSKHSCPTCRDDIQDPRPMKKFPRKIIIERKKRKEAPLAIQRGRVGFKSSKFKHPRRVREEDLIMHLACLSLRD